MDLNKVRAVRDGTMLFFVREYNRVCTTLLQVDGIVIENL